MGTDDQAAAQDHQLPLAVQLRDDATLDNFLPGPGNEPVLAALGDLLAGHGELAILLHGATGSGKSHLLQACCHQARVPSLYLPLSALRDYPPAEVLEGIDGMGLLCLDDLHAVLGDAVWERAVFNLYNRARETGQKLLMAAVAAPRQLPVQLPDLRSRLSWAVVFQLLTADDGQRAAILQFRARRRGMDMPSDVARFIVSRAPRGMDDLLERLALLDRASLAQQRPLSIPFVKKTLQL